MPTYLFTHYIRSLWLILLLITGCSAQNVPQAPTNQLIKGPFQLTTDWQTISLDKPLIVLPHSHSLKLLLGEQYQPIETIKTDNFYTMSHGYKHVTTNEAIKPEVILIDRSGKEFQAVMEAVGWRTTTLGDYHFLGYSTNSRQGKFFFPRGTEFVAVKLKANVAVTVQHLNWDAARYYQAPNHQWSDIHPSEIVTLH